MNYWEGIKIVPTYLPLLLFVPIYLIFIWQFYNPKKAIIRGQVTLLRRYHKPKRAFELRRWRYNPKVEADVTEEDIKQAKISATAAIIILTIIIIIIILMSNHYYGY